MHTPSRLGPVSGVAAIFAILLAAPLFAQDTGRPDGMRFIPDVNGQFRSLTRIPQALGLNRSTTPDPSLCRHYQGLARVDGADGTPFFLVTRSGNLPKKLGAGVVCQTSEDERFNGNLVVFRMGSRDRNGERLRSNRLQRGRHVDDTMPDAEDVATIYYTVVGGDDRQDPDPCRRPGLLFREGYLDADGNGENDCPSPPPFAYQHPGGMQAIGNVLAMAMDTPRSLLAECYAGCPILDPLAYATCLAHCSQTVHYEMATTASRIMFFDVTSPEDPQFLSQFTPTDVDGSVLPDADGLAITPLPGGHYLLAVSRGFEGDEPIHFFRSSSTDLTDPDLTWDYVDHDFDVNDEDENAHQSLHFLRQGDIDGALYLAAARGLPVFGSDDNKLDLIQVECSTPDCVPGSDYVSLTVRERGQEMFTVPNMGGETIANLAAATGFYESPSGELIFYATEHDNDGPNGTVKMAEWRHQDMVRDGSPTLMPSIELGGPFAVDEGSSTGLGGSAAPPGTRAFIQLFIDPDFAGFFPVVDFDDIGKDDFDDFKALEPFRGIIEFDYDHQAESWKWYAPVGCSIQAVDHATGNTATLPGTGAMVPAADLTAVFDDLGSADMNRKVDEVRFLDDCTNYYNTPVALTWDLDGDGAYESTGTSVPFSAATLDGPSVVVVPAQAQHPAGGAAAQASATVTINNVPPAISAFGLKDGGGNEVGVAIPYVLTGMPVIAAAHFADPGLPDHQTASLTWGDGVVDVQSDFALFDEAFGDGAGELRHEHRYSLPGTFGLALAVRDDDGGEAAAAASVRVVTPEQAVREMLATLDDLIANTTDPDLLATLLRIRKALAGSPPDGSRNGALARIQAGRNASAIAFLKDALHFLEAAQAQGVDVGGLITQVNQVIAALSTKAMKTMSTNRLLAPVGRVVAPVRY